MTVSPSPTSRPEPALAWRMPAETAPQARVWMALPPAGAAITATEHELETTRVAWTAVANAIVRFEPVTMVVDPGDVAAARPHLDPQIEILAAPLDDGWMRDIGPTFVLDAAGAPAAVDWVFNGWGRQSWARWERDARIAATVADAAAVPRIPSPLVNEGGAIVTDGRGTVVTTESVLLDPDRNPGLTRKAAEAELRRTLGAERVVWLERGLHRDALALGTRGHADMVVAIPAPDRMLVHRQADPAHPDHRITAAILERLAADPIVDRAGFELVELPAPTILRDRDGWVDLNYVNHLAINGAVIVPWFDDPADDTARGLLAESYPGREVVPVDARAIFACGGGIHCITQHQPLPTRPEGAIA